MTLKNFRSQKPGLFLVLKLNGPGLKINGPGLKINFPGLKIKLAGLKIKIGWS